MPFATVAVRPLGKLSVRLTFVAADGPLFVTEIWNVTVPPTEGVALADVRVFTVTRLAIALTVFVSVALLLPAVGSVVPEGTAIVAVFETLPDIAVTLAAMVS